MIMESRRRERRSHLFQRHVGAALCAAMMLAPLTALAQSPVTVDDAWVRAAPPAAQMLSGYFTVRNTADEPVALTRVESPDFARVEMHRSAIVDGVARMEPAGAVTVAARGEVAFTPGGLHLMLMDPLGAMPIGTTAVFVLTFDNGWTLEVTAPVRKAD
jgi:periplasmic copper chaperone A